MKPSPLPLKYLRIAFCSWTHLLCILNWVWVSLWPYTYIYIYIYIYMYLYQCMSIYIYIYVYNKHICVYAYVHLIIYYYVISYYIILYLSLPHSLAGRGGGADESLSLTGVHTASGINSQVSYFLINLFLTTSLWRVTGDSQFLSFKVNFRVWISINEQWKQIRQN
jgi:hypothetical protein